MSNGFLTEINDHDVIANRPAAAAANEGYNFHASDTGITYRSNGSSWDEVAIDTGAHASIDHTGLPGVGGGSGGIVGYDIEHYTGGNLNITSTTAGAAVTGPGTLTVPATAGDLLLVLLDANISSDSEGMRIDVGTIVSAAVVNYLSSLSGTPIGIGIPGWGGPSNQETRVTGSKPYVVQAGDISGGNVELALRAWISTSGGRTIQASTSSPLEFSVINFGQ